ncbi:50S ribosomal protein L19 [Burkholderia pseudomallei]|nr:50S ribosomal protein L19 [Burkholderia pseudomallei]CAJ4723708.1 50S ribosomal protein L19 [Burkholderia pseudomallei]CAJ8133517.1 50S ribosomal protein L19 [Burkholderia pseudomallei]CAJ8767675.1 50S ribosomal protein L19 [Burkholderia pseudomallei]CAJ9411786.1 50S ribosomal protein L19 [Burkholderia pseudomallei]
MRRGARAADAIRLFALHSRKGAGDTQGNSSCRRTSGGAAGEARRRPLVPARARSRPLVCAYVRSRRRCRARSPAGARSSPVTAVRGVRPTQAPCRCAARRAACRPGAAALMRRLLATRRAPSAKRRAPSAERRAPSAERRAPSAERRAPSAERRAPSAKRQAPSAKRQAPSAKRQAPSAKRQAPSAKRRSDIDRRHPFPPAGVRRFPAAERAPVAGDATIRPGIVRWARRNARRAGRPPAGTTKSGR